MKKKGFGFLTMADLEKRRQTRQIDDIGKLGALWRAGWTLNMIAEEFNVTEVTVAETLRRMRR